MRIRPSAPPRGSDLRPRGALLMPLCALAVGGLAGTVARALQTRQLSPIRPGLRSKPASQARSVLPVWALCAGVLLGLYCGQELAEGLLSPGHAAGTTGVFGHGGRIAVPLSLLLGAALAATLRVTEVLVRRIVRTRVADLPRAATNAPARRGPRASSRDWRLEPQSGLVAGRAPPLTLSLT